MNTALAIFLGGGLGSLARFGTSKVTELFVSKDFVAMNKSVNVAGTLLSNLISCLILAIALGLFKEKIIPGSFIFYLLIVGFCGGFSTFSTFSYETFTLINADQLIWAGINILISVFFCLGVMYAFMR